MRVGPGLAAAVGAVVAAAIILLGHRQLIQPIALTTRDHTDSYLRVQQYARELADGHWPQTLPDAVQGGGHAFPRYYPPLSQWAAVGIYALHRDVVAATHLAGLASIMLAGLACFLALHLLGAQTLPSTVASALYTLLPYSWVALDIRGAFAETWALVFYPLLLAGITLSLRRGKPVAWLPGAVAGSLASHVVMTAWALPVLAVVGLVAAGPGVKWGAVWRTAAAGAVGVGIMMFFFLPSLVELGALRAGDPVIVWATPEALAGNSWPFYESVFRSFRWWSQLEWAMLGLGLIGLWQARRDAGLPRRLCWSGLVAYAALAILARAPIEVWRVVPQSLRYIQFPERLLGIAGLGFAVTLAMATSSLRSRVGSVLVAVLGAVVALYAFRLGSQILPRSEETHPQVLARLQSSYPDRGLTVVGEYLPLGTEPETLARHIEQTRTQVGTPPLETWRREGGAYRTRVSLESPGEVRLPLVSYGFYRVMSSNGEVPTVSPAGLLTVRLGAGTHDLTVERHMPMVSKVGLVVTVLCLLAWPGAVRRLRA